jgi:photosystem II stability/assembly factor-like uncharacterized protein
MYIYKRAGALVAALFWFSISSSLAGAEKLPPPVVVKVAHVTLLDFAQVGKSLIAVGERGLVMRSSDEGQSWTGFNIQTSRTLTAIQFINDKVGVVVGHGGTILRTEDAGQIWQLIPVKDVGRDALLGISVLKNGDFVACGAFGLYLVSHDQGKSWLRQTIIDEEFDRHISKVIETRQSMVMVGETGVMARSDDGGKKWKMLKSPYAGSYFGVLEMKSGAWLAYGMRGNIYRSTDRGERWTKIPFDSKSSLNGGSLSQDGRVVLAGNNGLIAVSSDDGLSFNITHVPEGTSLSQARLMNGKDVVYIGHMATGRQSLANE